MKTATLKENAQTNCNQVPLTSIVALKRTTKVPVRLKKITREKAMEDALTYRIPMEVMQILKLPNEDCYPVCPRCKITVDREYMHYCDRCGQKLGWKKLKDAVFVYPGNGSAAKKDRKRHLSLF